MCENRLRGLKNSGFGEIWDRIGIETQVLKMQILFLFIFIYLLIMQIRRDIFIVKLVKHPYVVRLNEACGMISNIKFYNSFLEINVKSA